VTGFSVDAIALRTLVDYWPVFAAGALAEAWLVIKRMRRSRPFPPVWALTTAIAAAAMAVTLWVEPFLATQLVNETIGEGAHAEISSELLAHVQRSWPPAVGLLFVVLALVARPRSSALVAVLVPAAGFLASWIAAMWLFTTIHSPFVFRLLVVRGGLAVVASMAGFTTATALWMAIGRWIWRQGRRR
jgi:hypothetical protein